MSEPYNIKQYFRDSGAEPENAALSMLIGPGVFSYTITSADHKTIYELCEIVISNSSPASDDLSDKIRFQVNNYRLGQRRFSKIQIALYSPHFVLIPQAYADEEKARALLQLSSGLDVIKGLQHHQLGATGFWFIADKTLLNYLESTFSNASIRHAGAVNIALMTGSKALSACDLFMNVSETSIELVSKKGGEIVFYNVFACNTSEDILYYLLFTMEQLQLDPLQARLYIATQRHVNDPLFVSIKKYIRHVEFCVTTGLVYKGDLAQLPSHAYFTLLNQYQCEL